MRLRDRYQSRDRARSSLVAFSLLFLIAHAVLVSVTHCHRVERTESVSSSPGVSDGSDAVPSPVAGGHAQCLLCRLQRNFVSDPDDPIPVIGAPPQQRVVRETLSPKRYANETSLDSAGRAPPLA